MSSDGSKTSNYCDEALRIEADIFVRKIIVRSQTISDFLLSH